MQITSELFYSIRHFSKTIMFLSILINFGGCAFFSDLDKIHQTEQRVCNYDGAFAEGMNDAKNSQPMDSERIMKYCSGSIKEEAGRGYREGYMTGKKSK